MCSLRLPTSADSGHRSLQADAFGLGTAPCRKNSPKAAGLKGLMDANSDWWLIARGCSSAVVSWLAALAFFCSAFLLSKAQAQTEKGTSTSEPSRAVLTVPDAYPLSQAVPELRADYAGIIKSKHFVYSQLSWSNTINRDRGEYIVDAETLRLNTGYVLRVNGRLQFEAELPLHWSGGGIADEAIYRWHQLFSLPQGPRDDQGVGNNDYQISGELDSGQKFQLKNNQLAQGDLSFAVKRLIHSTAETGSKISLLGHLQLPTGEGSYGLDAPALTSKVLGLTRFEDLPVFGLLYLHSGLGVTYLTNSSLDTIALSKWRYSAFLQLEKPFSLASAYLSFLYGSELVENISNYPRYQVYFDTGAKFDLGDSSRLVFSFRENPAPSNGTSDFAVHAGIEYSF